jgi:proteic killer suppression protein
MEADFDDDSLRRLEEDPNYTGGFDPGIVKAFRKRMAFIRSAPDERDFYKMKSLHFEKLQGNRAGQHSMRLNDQWRLILRFEKREGGKVVVVVSITDYH